jgi:histidinol phosphatase-like enzyme
MKYPKVVIIDRDGTINLASSQEGSPFYYILNPDHIILKPGAKDALAIIAAHAVPFVYLATKQRCISKGLINHDGVAAVNRMTSDLLSFQFTATLVEPEAKTKASLYREILAHHSDIPHERFLLLDDSADEREAASALGMSVGDGSKLYEEVCRLFSVR